jgi:hypothetical protein
MKLDALGPLGEAVGNPGGEGRQVCRVPRHPGWLFKEYQSALPIYSRDRLEKLVHLPYAMSADEIALVDGNTSWPSSTIVDEAGRGVGVLIPEAPSRFSTALNTRTGRTVRTVLEFDLLALPSYDQERRGLSAGQSMVDRLMVCASLARVAALLEAKGLIYLDWSYGNAFWDILRHDAYVIDLDGSSFEKRPNIQSNSFDDPRVPQGEKAGLEVDRYRLALLFARAITGTRGELQDTLRHLGVIAQADSRSSDVARLLKKSLEAPTIDSRVTCAELYKTLESAVALKGTAQPSPNTAPTGGVKGWTDLRNRPQVNLHPNPPASAPTPHPTPPKPDKVYRPRPSTVPTGATTGGFRPSNAGSPPNQRLSQDRPWSEWFGGIGIAIAFAVLIVAGGVLAFLSR